MPHALPDRYRFAHDYSIFLHDLIVGQLIAGIESHVFMLRVDLVPDEGDPCRDLKGADLYDCLERTKGPEFTALLDYVMVLPGVLGDFCQFVLEGLRASAKGKLTVAYALFRKPFKDNLFYLEWILAEPVNFIMTFREKGPEGLESARRDADFRLDIIRKAIKASNNPVSDPEFINELRFDRKARYGLAVPWDQAIHLVTTSRDARTSPQNLNFVFSGPEEWESQWMHVYHIAPYLLFHALHVVDALMATVAKVDPEWLEMKQFRRDLGFMLLGQAYDHDHLTSTSKARQDLSEALRTIVDELKIECTTCNTIVRLHDRNLRSFVLRGSVRCRTCKTSLQIDETDKPEGMTPNT